MFIKFETYHDLVKHHLENTEPELVIYDGTTVCRGRLDLEDLQIPLQVRNEKIGGLFYKEGVPYILLFLILP